jgi:hypothetical protein
MSLDDPYTRCINALWAAIEADDTLSGLVKTGNRIKLTGDVQDPRKKNVQDADLPEIIIAPATAQVQPHFTSTSVMIVETFAFSLATNRVTVDDVYYPVKWALLQVLITAANDNLNLKSFVKQVEFNDDIVQAVQATQENNRDTAGWSLGLTLTVSMTFTRNQNVVIYLD